jgi:hypothetical protein
VLPQARPQKPGALGSVAFTSIATALRALSGPSPRLAGARAYPGLDPAFSISFPARIVATMSLDCSRYALPSSNSIAG